VASEIKLNKTWSLGDQIGDGGFGTVFVATSDDEVAALKFVPKDPGAERELLFVELGDVENVVPIIESGETEDAWVLVMSLAETSLRKELQESGGRLSIGSAVAVAADVLTALAGIEGHVIHRDLKPENVLKLNGRWCLADFGISRYAEATTAPDTRKHALSPPYAAPERWRNEQVSSATDIYSFGVMVYEMLAGTPPFGGPTIEDFREQHLHDDPPELADVPDALAALLQECLYKSPEARPSARNAAERLSRVGVSSPSGGVASLEAANRAAVAKRSEDERQASQAQTEAERRDALAADGRKALERIGDSLRKAIVNAAPTATVQGEGGYGWKISLQGATLDFTNPGRADPGTLNAFDVVIYAALGVTAPSLSDDYEGRSHSLWFCDAQATGSYGWFETAFMVTPMVPERGLLNPFALPPGDEAAQAVEPAMGTRQVAWPFTRLDLGDLEEFVDRWAGWLGKAASNALHHPMQMPERSPRGSWRQG
jgi:serine/threonine-protein kinase